MLLDLAVRLGPDAAARDAVKVFDALVLRGLLKPADHSLWELAPISDAELQEIVARG